MSNGNHSPQHLRRRNVHLIQRFLCCLGEPSSLNNALFYNKHCVFYSCVEANNEFLRCPSDAPVHAHALFWHTLTCDPLTPCGKNREHLPHTVRVFNYICFALQSERRVHEYPRHTPTRSHDLLFDPSSASPHALLTSSLLSRPDSENGYWSERRRREQWDSPLRTHIRWEVTTALHALRHPCLSIFLPPSSTPICPGLFPRSFMDLSTIGHWEDLKCVRNGSIPTLLSSVGDW